MCGTCACVQMEAHRKAMSRPCSPPSGAERLFDLIECSDESLRPALYLAVRDTLVVRDLDEAVRTAYVGDKAVWRVVTLDGEWLCHKNDVYMYMYITVFVFVIIIVIR